MQPIGRVSGINWSRNKRRTFIGLTEGEFVIENDGIINFYLDAYVCRQCKKMVIDYEDKYIAEKNDK